MLGLPLSPLGAKPPVQDKLPLIDPQLMQSEKLKWIYLIILIQPREGKDNGL